MHLKRHGEINDFNPSRQKISKGGRVALAGVALLGVGAIGFGVSSMTKQEGFSNNVSDMQDLAAFTSPAHQEDRQNTQDAVDAQETMRQFFADQGGITDEQLALFAPNTGLTEEQLEGLTSTQLYPFDYDGHEPEASTSLMTKGLIAGGLGLGLLAGAGVVAAPWAYDARRRRMDEAVQASVDTAVISAFSEPQS